MPADALPALLDASLSRDVAELRVIDETIDLRTLDGPEHKLERTSFAEALAGTSDKKSRAYKAQRRNVERWAKGRRPKLVSVQRIVRVQRERSARVKAFRERGADVRVRVRFYGDRRPETLPPRRWLHIPREAMRGVVRSWAAGDHADAADRLRRATWNAYNVPNIGDWMRDVFVDELHLEPSGGGSA